MYNGFHTILEPKVIMETAARLCATNNNNPFKTFFSMTNERIFKTEEEEEEEEAYVEEKLRNCNANLKTEKDRRLIDATKGKTP
jgi:hypothetical protein